MTCKLQFLKEQKYMGIKTKVLFQAHDDTDFRQLQMDVINAGITHRDDHERFMALDSDFQADSFCYAPLVPVTAFEGEAYFRFARQAGEYYCFEVNTGELGPKWFQDCNAYIEQNKLRIDRTFDMEYYPEDYMQNMKAEQASLADQTISVVFRKLDETHDVAPNT